MVTAFRRVGDDATKRIPLAGSRAAMQALIWAEVKTSGLRQAEIAALAGITEKHLSQIMQGRITGSLDNVDRILAACGRELVLATRVATTPSTQDGHHDH